MKQRCCECHCTEDRACPGGCGWAEPGLCTRCVGIHGMRTLKQKLRSAATRWRKKADASTSAYAVQSAMARAEELDGAAAGLEEVMNRTIEARNGETLLRMRQAGGL